MSYRRTYNTTVTGHSTVSYPASQNGGTQSVSIDVPIAIDVLVDTDSFDKSISHCSGKLTGLTGAVVATESAEIIAIDSGAREISKSIVDGFFGYIRSEISQQISEYRPKVDVLLIELVKEKEACISKKSQMLEDFSRISERYMKIFQDLDKELVNRIKTISQAVFSFSREATDEISRAFGNSIFNAAAVLNTNRESAQSMLFASGIKRRALKIIESAKHFLVNNLILNKKLDSILIAGFDNSSSTLFIPIILFETYDESQTLHARIIQDSDFAIDISKNNELLNFFPESRDHHWMPMTENDKNQIEFFIQLELNKRFTNSNNHDRRVTEKILQLWNANKTYVLSY